MPRGSTPHIATADFAITQTSDDTGKSQYSALMGQSSARSSMQMRTSPTGYMQAATMGLPVYSVSRESGAVVAVRAVKKHNDSMRLKANVSSSSLTSTGKNRDLQSPDGASTNNVVKTASTIQTPVSQVSPVQDSVKTSDRRVKRKSIRSIPTAILSQQIGPNSTGSNFSSMSSNSRSEIQHSAFYAPMVEFLPGRLYFDCARTAPYNVPEDAHVFTIDSDFKYIPFYADFGPLSIAQVYRFSQLMNAKLSDPALARKKFVIITSSAADKCSNAAVLICCYLVLYHGKTPDQVLEPIELKAGNLSLTQYRDAGYGPATYWIGIGDCVRALYKGVQFGFFDIEKFDVKQYEFYEKVENGDFNWVLPKCFLALATPHDTPPEHLIRFHDEVKAGRIVLQLRSIKFEPLIEIEPLMEFLKSPAMNVKAVIRLNNKVYDREKVLEAGLEHYELYFPDGSVPPFETIVKKFVAIADHYLPVHLLAPDMFPAPKPGDRERGGLAVHCKAGLGRTGTLISCWIMKTFGWSAREVISWCRIMRPGSVVGPQQNWLTSMEQRLWTWGEEDRMKRDVQILIGHPVLSVKDSEKNEGNETLTKSTMGMQVPVQPNKQERARISNSAEMRHPVQIASTTSSALSTPSLDGDLVHDDTHEYFLRSNDPPMPASESVANQLVNEKLQSFSLMQASSASGKRRVSATSIQAAMADI